MSPSLPRPISLAALTLLLTQSACQSTRSPTGTPVSAGLESLAAEPFPETGDRAIAPDVKSDDPNSLESRIAQAALDLERVFQDREQTVPSTARVRRTPTPEAAPSKASAEQAGAVDSTPTFGLEGGTESTSPEPSTAAPIPTEHESSIQTKGKADTSPATSVTRVAAVASHLASSLRQRGDGDRSAIPDALVLTTLESLRPGVMNELDKPDSAMSRALSSEDRKDLLAARDRVAADPNARTTASDSLSKTLQAFMPPATLQIPKAALCTRVQGFGKYDAITSEKFLVGKPIRALVYTELDGFTTRESRAGDPGQSGLDPPKYAVELSQSVTLYHDPSGLVAWQRPPQTVVEPCRAKRRDFFLVQRLDLPATLSIGKYNLKVRVTDVTSGAEAEVILPISVVADPALVRR
jgi:hypothetical protein